MRGTSVEAGARSGASGMKVRLVVYGDIKVRTGMDACESGVKGAQEGIQGRVAKLVAVLGNATKQ